MKKNLKKTDQSSNGGNNVSARFETLVDLVQFKNSLQYLVKEPEGLEVKDHHINEAGQKFVPPRLENIPFKPILHLDQVLCYINDDNGILYHDIKKRLRDVAVLPSEAHYSLVTVYIFFTYLPEAVRYYPYLWIYGQPEMGKSRIIKAINNLSYRGIYTESLNQAFLFRFADRFCGTIAFDVYELVDQAKRRSSYDLLLGRYERGMVIPRVLRTDANGFDDTSYFEASGATILGTNVEIPLTDPLRSRCIRIVMPEARGRYPNNNSPEDLLDLRARLTAFRARHIGEELPEVEKPVAGRLGDITHPLLCVAKILPEEATEDILELVKILEQNRKDEQGETLAGQIAKALYDLREKVRNGRLSVEEVRNKLRDNHGPTPSVQAVGMEMNALGIERKKSNGLKYILWEQEKMESLWNRYGVCDTETP